MLNRLAVSRTPTFHSSFQRVISHRIFAGVTTVQRRPLALSRTTFLLPQTSPLSRYLNTTSNNDMEAVGTKLSIAERLKLFNYTRTSLGNAVDGKEVPLELGVPEVQACIIRGIRHHDGFGSELRGHAPFDRALNARSIMSNRIPKISNAEEVPYCIWHPEIATEETYRRLVTAYPYMSYQVGRACAVAGYEKLYTELDILPEVAIAEEARDNQHNAGSLAIFKTIMSAPCRYAVMNDYTREINHSNPELGAVLNADTAVLSSLGRKRRYSREDFEDTYGPPESVKVGGKLALSTDTYEPVSGYETYETYWNITEDWNFDHKATPVDGHTTQGPDDLRIPLLYSPLPKDLPPINKDMLILHAAWSGNIDRYTRLRRPKDISIIVEEQCNIRGIHYSTAFAKWWSLQPGICLENEKYHSKDRIVHAIHARFIMDNNLAHITENVLESDLPYVIYWPNLAHEKTYAELYRRKPSMKLQIARACIIGDYVDLYKSLDVEQDGFLIEEARASVNPFFLEDQLKKEGTDECYPGYEEWKSMSVKDLLYSTGLSLMDASDMPVGLGYFPVEAAQYGIWGGFEMDLDALDRAIGGTRAGLYKAT